MRTSPNGGCCSLHRIEEERYQWTSSAVTRTGEGRGNGKKAFSLYSSASSHREEERKTIFSPPPAWEGMIREREREESHAPPTMETVIKPIDPLLSSTVYSASTVEREGGSTKESETLFPSGCRNSYYSYNYY